MVTGKRANTHHCDLSAALYTLYFSQQIGLWLAASFKLVCTHRVIIMQADISKISDKVVYSSSPPLISDQTQIYQQ